MLTLTDAAKRLGVTADTLRQQIHSKSLAATKIGPLWLVDEIDLDRYAHNHLDRVGRPFVGRAGVVDTRHVRVLLLPAPADGRGEDSIWVEYLDETFVANLDWSDPKPYKPTGAAYPIADLTDDPPPGGRRIEVWSRAKVQREIGYPSPNVEILCDRDVEPLPRPVVTFRDGPIWDASSVRDWKQRQSPMRANSFAPLW